MRIEKAMGHNANSVALLENAGFTALEFRPRRRAFQGTGMTLFCLAYQLMFRVALFARQLNY